MTDRPRPDDLGRMSQHFEALDHDRDPLHDLGSAVRLAAGLMLAAAFVAGLLIGGAVALWWVA